MKFISILIFTTLIICLVGCSTAGVFNITVSTGEKWVEWNWTIPQDHVNINHQLIVRVDGVIVSNESISTNGSYLTNYHLTPFNADTESNERHVILLSEYDNTSALVYSDSDIAMTKQSSFYYYMMFVIGVVMMIAAFILRNRLFSVVISTASILVFMFLAMVHINFNTSFTIVNILFAVVAAFITIFSLYELFIPSFRWDSD